MSWEDVFGEIWFWTFAGLIWLRTGLSAYGVRRRLIAEAMTARGAAQFARDLVRYRLGPGHPIPRGLLPLRWAGLLAGVGYFAIDAFWGDMLALALLTAIAPVAIVSLALEPRALKAVAIDDLERFADALEQIWRVRFAATAGSALLTFAAAALSQP